MGRTEAAQSGIHPPKGCKVRDSAVVSVLDFRAEFESRQGLGSFSAVETRSTGSEVRVQCYTVPPLDRQFQPMPAGLAATHRITNCVADSLPAVIMVATI